MRRSKFVFNSVDLLHYNLHKISLNKGGSYKNSLEWLKNEKATINLKGNDDKCFQYAITASLNYEQIKSYSERISSIKPFTDQYNWKEISFPSHQKDCKKLELNIKSIALNILYVPCNTEEIKHAYVSKYNTNCENQVIPLMITDGKKWHYLAVKRLPALFRGVTSKHVGDF